MTGHMLHNDLKLCLLYSLQSYWLVSSTTTALDTENTDEHANGIKQSAWLKQWVM